MSSNMKFNASRRQIYRAAGYWGDATLSDHWEMAVLSVPDKKAVIDSRGASYTYRELDEAAGRVASFLVDMGVAPGDFVSFQLPGWVEFTLIYMACLKAGAVANPILPNYRTSELLYLLNECRSKIFFMPEDFRRHKFTEMHPALIADVPSLKKIVVVDKFNCDTRDLTLNQVLQNYAPLKTQCKRKSDDLAAVLFTSGTEGHPKGVMLTHNNIIASEKAFNAAFNINFQDVMLMPAPVAHATGFLHGVTAPLMAGAMSVLQDIFVPQVTLDLIERYRCTCSMGSTPFVEDLLKEMAHNPHDISSLRFFMCGGAPIPRHTVENALEHGVNVVAVYGSTESAPHAATRPGDSTDKIVYTDGAALSGIEVRVVDRSRNPVAPGVVGEEASRGPNVFMGYLNAPELTAKVLDDDGWYYSGDLCTMDKEGYIKITGRKKDIIIRGGENISSKEVEDILLQHPNVHEVGVVAMPDARLGEKACAYVVLENPDVDFSFQEMIRFFDAQKVAKYKYPERLEKMLQLPRTASGKIQKNLLRQDILNKLSAQELPIKQP